MQVLILSNEESGHDLLPIRGSRVQLQSIAGPRDFIDTGRIDACIDLSFEFNNERIAWLKSLGSDLVVVNAVDNTLGEIGESFIRINGWPTLLSRPVVEASAPEGKLRVKAEELLWEFDKTIQWIPDIPGFISARVVAGIINEAYYALEQGVSTEDEIDIAMTLGTNYPFGPFEWSRKIGLQRIHSLLLTLEKQQTGHSPSSLLTHKALA